MKEPLRLSDRQLDLLRTAAGSLPVEKREAFEALAQKIELIVRPPPAATVTNIASERSKRATA